MKNVTTGHMLPPCEPAPNISESLWTSATLKPGESREIALREFTGWATGAPGRARIDDGADAKLNDVLYGALCDYPEQWYDPPVYVERRLRLGAASYLLHIGNEK